MEFTFDVVVPRASKARGNVLVKVGELRLDARSAALAVSRTAMRQGFTMRVPPKLPMLEERYRDAPLSGPGYDLLDFAVVQVNDAKMLSIGSMRYLEKLMRVSGFQLT